MLKKLLNYSITLYIFLLPWQVRFLFSEYSMQTPYYGGLSVYITDLLFLLVVGIWLFWFFKNRRLLQQKLKMKTKQQAIVLGLFLLFILYAFISAFWFPLDSFELALIKWLRLLQASVFVLIIATAPIKVRMIFIAFIASGLLQSLWGIQQFFLQEIPANTVLGVSAQNPADLGVSVIEYADQRWLRAYGGLPHPNILGAFLTLCALATSAWIFSVYKQVENLKNRWDSLTIKEVQPIRIQLIASLMAFCFIIIGLLFTFSRTAWLGFAIGWGILFFSLIYLAKTKYAKKLMILSGLKQVIAGILILFALTYLIGPLWTSRANDMSRLGQKSFSERAVLIDQANQIVDQAPLRGSGIGSYTIKLQELNLGTDIFAHQPVHNLWLLLWAELGWVGLMSFFGFIAFVYFAGVTIIKKKVDSLNGLMSISALLSIGVMVYFEHFWWTLLFGNLILALWLGIFLHMQLFERK